LGTAHRTFVRQSNQSDKRRISRRFIWSLGFFESYKKSWSQIDEKDPDGEWEKAWTKEWLEEFVEMNTKNLDAIAQDPIYAIRDVVHAVSAKHPRLRYLSGALAKTLFYFLWKMPEEWSFTFKKATLIPNPEFQDKRS